MKIYLVSFAEPIQLEAIKESEMPILVSYHFILDKKMTINPKTVQQLKVGKDNASK